MSDAPETLSGAADAPLLRRMGELMSHMRLGSRGSKKLRRKEGGSMHVDAKQAPEVRRTPLRLRARLVSRGRAPRRMRCVAHCHG